ncbi:MAG: hypothetical protein RQ754_02980 [Desulfuromonadales bacterium]|nr:hypothetical protein [Desulfuromonadales bacterium]
MNQMSMFTGEERKAEGLSVIEENHGDFLETMRTRARKIAAEKGSVTSDDLRAYAACWGIEPAHPNAWGGIFRGSEWECIGFKKSTLPSNHARLVRVWRLKNKGERS